LLHKVSFAETLPSWELARNQTDFALKLTEFAKQTQMAKLIELPKPPINLSTALEKLKLGHKFAQTISTHDCNSSLQCIIATDNHMMSSIYHVRSPLMTFPLISRDGKTRIGISLLHGFNQCCAIGRLDSFLLKPQ